MGIKWSGPELIRQTVCVVSRTGEFGSRMIKSEFYLSDTELFILLEFGFP